MNGPIIDFGSMLKGVLPQNGLDPERLDGDLAVRFEAAFVDVEERRKAGQIGFFELPGNTALAIQTQHLADTFGQWFETIVVLGIGGSALGTRTIREALLGPGWNELDEEQREHFPRIYILDNPDPDSILALLGRLDLARTLFNVVSKSGSTAETMAQFMIVWDRLSEELGEEKTRGHFLFTTSPDSGVLRTLADEHGIQSLPVPNNVGGRFSVLSPVGLLPACVAGVDIGDVLAGAADMMERCASPVLKKNPAGMLATLLHAADTEQGLPIHVLMPYADRLGSFAQWFQQLWAESLGKALDREGQVAEVGPTPLPAVGAVDQHSQVQLFMEGPRDKVMLFIRRESADRDVEVPSLFLDQPALAYLGGRSLFELLDAEQRATAEALRRQGRPSLTISIATIDARSLGGLFMLFQIATVYAGVLYNVDPLDQPGVELGKILTYGLMGRDGFEAPEIPDPDPRWRV